MKCLPVFIVVVRVRNMPSSFPLCNDDFPFIALKMQWLPSVSIAYKRTGMLLYSHYTHRLLFKELLIVCFCSHQLSQYVWQSICAVLLLGSHVSCSSGSIGWGVLLWAKLPVIPCCCRQFCTVLWRAARTFFSPVQRDLRKLVNAIRLSTINACICYRYIVI